MRGQREGGMATPVVGPSCTDRRIQLTAAAHQGHSQRPSSKLQLPCFSQPGGHGLLTLWKNSEHRAVGDRSTKTAARITKLPPLAICALRTIGTMT